MNKKLLQVCVLSLLLVLSSSSKRGLAWPWNGDGSDFALFENNPEISWVYNWEAWVPSGFPGGWEYVAMQRTASDISDLESYMQSNGASTLLGFNEPDISDQANMSPGEAVQLWNQYIEPLGQSMGLRLGSPAISNGPNGLPWLQQFMSQCSGCNVGFIACHWYGGDFSDFQNQIQSINNAFPGYNIWVTEVALQTSDDSSDQESFFSQAGPWMDSTGYIERYAWFGAFRGGSGYSLIDGNGNLTPLGDNYLGSSGATDNSDNAQPQPSDNSDNYQPQSSDNSDNYQPQSSDNYQPSDNSDNYQPQSSDNYQPQSSDNSDNYQPQSSDNYQSSDNSDNYQPQSSDNYQSDGSSDNYQSDGSSSDYQ